jgi:hypothetical protein
MLLKGLRSHTSSTAPFYWFMTGTMCKFTEGVSLHIFSTIPFTGSRLVLRASLLKGHRSHNSSNAQITSFQLVFYVTEVASHPHFQYYSVYWFTTGITC